MTEQKGARSKDITGKEKGTQPRNLILTGKKRLRSNLNVNTVTCIF
jgi:hypothetical protein